jgi:hypothetical protein
MGMGANEQPWRFRRQARRVPTSDRSDRSRARAGRLEPPLRREAGAPRSRAPRRQGGDKAPADRRLRSSAERPPGRPCAIVGPRSRSTITPPRRRWPDGYRRSSRNAFFGGLFLVQCRPSVPLVTDSWTYLARASSGASSSAHTWLRDRPPSMSPEAFGS